MITFDKGNLRFVYRVAGIAINKDRVLLQASEKEEDSWSLPGGRGEFLEPSRETLKREMREELGVEVKVGRLIWVVENFYSGKDFITDDEMSCHEVGLYYMMNFPEKSPFHELTEFYSEDGGFKIIFKWHQLGEIGNTPLYPSFLRTALNRIPETVEHIVHTDEYTSGWD